MLVYLLALYVPKPSRYLINESKEKDEIEREGKERKWRVGRKLRISLFQYFLFQFTVYLKTRNHFDLNKLFTKYTKKFIIDKIKRAQQKRMGEFHPYTAR